MNEILTAIGPYLTSLIIAIITYLVTVLNTKKLKTKLKDIEDSIMNSDQDFYVICPNCEQKIILSKVKLYAQVKEEAKLQETFGNFNTRVKGKTESICKTCGKVHKPQDNCEAKPQKTEGGK